MSVTGLLPCRLNNPNSFIFFPRSCFPNLWSFSLPSPWMPSSWLLTMLCPKLDVEPFPTLSGADRLFRAFSLHTPKQRFFEGQGWGNFIPCMTVWLPQPQVHDPLLSQMRCPAHTDQAQEELRRGSSPPALTMELQGRQLQGRSRSRQGREGKAARSAEHWQPSSQGTGEQDMLQAGFLWWSGNQLWFLTPYSTKPDQTASSTAQL